MEIENRSYNHTENKAILSNFYARFKSYLGMTSYRIVVHIPSDILGTSCYKHPIQPYKSQCYIAIETLSQLQRSYCIRHMSQACIIYQDVLCMVLCLRTLPELVCMSHCYKLKRTELCKNFKSYSAMLYINISLFQLIQTIRFLCFIYNDWLAP